MKRPFAVLKALALTSICAGCATSFTGSAFVEDGRGGCETKCRAEGLEFVGMVYMGEYSDACVCALPGRSASQQRSLNAGVSAVAGGASGVVMQARRQQEQAHHGY